MSTTWSWYWAQRPGLVVPYLAFLAHGLMAFNDDEGDKNARRHAVQPPTAEQPAKEKTYDKDGG